MNVTFETTGGNVAGKTEWLTPPYIIERLGNNFDLDPCSPINRPFETAKNYFNIEDNGLAQPWSGFVWCNPPYGKESAAWLNRCAIHGNCIALIFARTETRAFFDHVWSKAKAVLFIKGRLKFYHVSGERGNSAGAPSVLIAFDEESAEVLKGCSIKGKFLIIN
jgi:hypothetical protein